MGKAAVPDIPQPHRPAGERSVVIQTDERNAEQDVGMRIGGAGPEPSRHRRVVGAVMIREWNEAVLGLCRHIGANVREWNEAAVLGLRRANIARG